MATEEDVIIDVPAVEGIRVRQEPETSQGITVWRVEQGEAGMFTSLATVRLVHPSIDPYQYAQNPINDEQITITAVGESTWSRQGRAMTHKAALGVAVALQEAANKAMEVLKEIEPKVAERLAEARKREEEERKRRAEREAKRREFQEKNQKLREKIQELEGGWISEMTEALKWYEGQAGRLKRKSKKGWDTFHELGAINGNHIFWMWSGQRFSDALTEVDKVEIRYESERSFDKIDLPEYPKEITELRKEVETLRREAWSY
jgi:hypothetical protein